MKYALLIPLLALPLGGCPSATIGSVVGGECSLPGLHTPIYAVRGVQKYDQEWIDDATESLVRGCRQSRPKARPASIDNPPHVQIKMTSPTTGVTVKPKKNHWWQR